MVGRLEDAVDTPSAVAAAQNVEIVSDDSEATHGAAPSVIESVLSSSSQAFSSAQEVKIPYDLHAVTKVQFLEIQSKVLAVKYAITNPLFSRHTGLKKSLENAFKLFKDWAEFPGYTIDLTLQIAADQSPVLEDILREAAKASQQ